MEEREAELVAERQKRMKAEQANGGLESLNTMLKAVVLRYRLQEARRAAKEQHAD